MMTYGSLASMTSTAALAGLSGSGDGLGSTGLLSRSENEALAVSKVMDANIIQPKKDEDDGLLIKPHRLGLSSQTYDAMGQVGAMTAMKRGGGLIDELI